MAALFINPDSSVQAYQGLAKVYSAIEPPTWSLLLAESCRSKGFDVAILGCDAERLSLDQSLDRVQTLKPRIVVLAVYGQNPNSGTTSMIGALALAKAIKDAYIDTKVCFWDHTRVRFRWRCWHKIVLTLCCLMRGSMRCTTS